MNEAFLCEGVRTPIGRYGGALSAVRPDDLAAHVIRALMTRVPDLPGDAIDDVILGGANQAGEDNRNVARMAALLAGLPQSVPGATINRLCGSGLNAVGAAAQAIRTGEAEVILAGGREHVARALCPVETDRGLRPRSRASRHHHRLALRQQTDEIRIRCRFDAGDRGERRRRVSGKPRRSGRLRVPLADPRAESP